MEKRSRFTKKLINLFWGLIGGLPLLFFMSNILICCFKNGIRLECQDLTQFYNANTQLVSQSIGQVTSQFNFITYSPLYSTLRDLIKTLLNMEAITQTPIIFTLYCLVWYIITQLIHIVVDFILLLPNICKRLFRKVGGDYE